MLPSKKELTEWLLASFDKRWYDAVWAQMAYAFGQKWNMAPSYMHGSTTDGDIPVYPEVQVGYLPVGQSRRILNASIRSLSTRLSKAPLPKWPQVDEVHSEVRAQFWLANANGNRGLPTKWLKQLQYAYVEGDTLGVGCVKHGLVTNPKSGLQQCALKHVPVLQAFWDAFESDPRNSRRVCVISYLPYPQAVALYGEAKCKPHKRQWTVTADARAVEFVRIAEIWDVGYAGKEPCYAFSVGSVDDWERSENELGFIPVSFCVNYVCPGMRRPIGRVMTQMSTQEAINDIEKYCRNTLKKPPVDVLLADMFDEDDLASFEAGTTTVLKLKQDAVQQAGHSIARLGGQEVQQGVLAYLGMMERQYNDDSNQTEQHRGNALGSRTTAKEVMSLLSRAQESASLTDQQCTEFLQDAVENTMNCAMAGDRHPVSLDVFGSNVLFNDPKDPQMAIANFLSEDNGTVLIDLEATTSQDDMVKRQLKKEDLQFIAPLVGMTIDPMAYTRESLEAMGETNIEQWLAKEPGQQVFGQAPA